MAENRESRILLRKSSGEFSTSAYKGDLYLSADLPTPLNGTIEDATFLNKNTFCEGSSLPKMSESFINLLKSGQDDSHLFPIFCTKSSLRTRYGSINSQNSSRVSQTFTRNSVDNSVNKQQELSCSSADSTLNTSAKVREITNPFKKPNLKKTKYSFALDTSREENVSSDNEKQKSIIIESKNNPFKKKLNRKKYSVRFENVFDSPNENNQEKNSSPKVEESIVSNDSLTNESIVSKIANPFKKANIRKRYSMAGIVETTLEDSVDVEHNETLSSPQNFQENAKENPFKKRNLRKFSLNMSLDTPDISSTDHNQKEIEENHQQQQQALTENLSEKDDDIDKEMNASMITVSSATSVEKDVETKHSSKEDNFPKISLNATYNLPDIREGYNVAESSCVLSNIISENLTEFKDEMVEYEVEISTEGVVCSASHKNLKSTEKQVDETVVKNQRTSKDSNTSLVIARSISVEKEVENTKIQDKDLRKDNFRKMSLITTYDVSDVCNNGNSSHVVKKATENTKDPSAIINASMEMILKNKPAGGQVMALAIESSNDNKCEQNHIHENPSEPEKILVEKVDRVPQEMTSFKKPEATTDPLESIDPSVNKLKFVENESDLCSENTAIDPRRSSLSINTTLNDSDSIAEPLNPFKKARKNNYSLDVQFESKISSNQTVSSEVNTPSQKEINSKGDIGKEINSSVNTVPDETSTAKHPRKSREKSVSKGIQKVRSDVTEISRSKVCVEDMWACSINKEINAGDTVNQTSVISEQLSVSARTRDTKCGNSSVVQTRLKRKDQMENSEDQSSLKGKNKLAVNLPPNENNQEKNSSPKAEESIVSNDSLTNESIVSKIANPFKKANIRKRYSMAGIVETTLEDSVDVEHNETLSSPQNLQENAKENPFKKRNLRKFSLNMSLDTPDISSTDHNQKEIEENHQQQQQALTENLSEKDDDVDKEMNASRITASSATSIEKDVETKHSSKEDNFPEISLNASYNLPDIREGYNVAESSCVLSNIISENLTEFKDEMVEYEVEISTEGVVCSASHKNLKSTEKQVDETVVKNQRTSKDSNTSLVIARSISVEKEVENTKIQDKDLRKDNFRKMSLITTYDVSDVCNNGNSSHVVKEATENTKNPSAITNASIEMILKNKPAGGQVMALAIDSSKDNKCEQNHIHENPSEPEKILVEKVPKEMTSFKKPEATTDPLESIDPSVNKLKFVENEGDLCSENAAIDPRRSSLSINTTLNDSDSIAEPLNSFKKARRNNYSLDVQFESKISSNQTVSSEVNTPSQKEINSKGDIGKEINSSVNTVPDETSTAKHPSKTSRKSREKSVSKGIQKVKSKNDVTKISRSKVCVEDKRASSINKEINAVDTVNQTSVISEQLSVSARTRNKKCGNSSVVQTRLKGKDQIENSKDQSSLKGKNKLAVNLRKHSWKAKTGYSFRTKEDNEEFGELSQSFDISAISSDKLNATKKSKYKSTPIVPRSTRSKRLSVNFLIPNQSRSSKIKEGSRVKQMESIVKEKTVDSLNNFEFTAPKCIPRKSSITGDKKRRRSVTFRAHSSLIPPQVLSTNIDKTNVTKRKSSNNSHKDSITTSSKQSSKNVKNYLQMENKTNKDISYETSLDVSEIIQETPKQRKRLIFHSTPKNRITSMASPVAKKRLRLSNDQESASSLYTTTETDAVQSDICTTTVSKTLGKSSSNSRSSRDMLSYNSHTCMATRITANTVRQSNLGTLSQKEIKTRSRRWVPDNSDLLLEESSCFNRPPDDSFSTSFSNDSELARAQPALEESAVAVETQERSLRSGTLQMTLRSSRISLQRSSVRMDTHLHSVTQTTFNENTVVPEKSLTLVPKFSKKKKANDSVFGNIQKKKVYTHNEPLPKLAKPAKWIKKELYTFLDKKLSSKYLLEKRYHSERIVLLLYNAVTNTLLGHPELSLQTLKEELVKYDICKTQLDYFTFVNRYTPLDFIKKVVPMGRAYGIDIKHKPVKIYDPLV